MDVRTLSALSFPGGPHLEINGVPAQTGTAQNAAEHYEHINFTSLCASGNPVAGSLRQKGSLTFRQMVAGDYLTLEKGNQIHFGGLKILSLDLLGLSDLSIARAAHPAPINVTVYSRTHEPVPLEEMRSTLVQVGSYVRVNINQTDFHFQVEHHAGKLIFTALEPNQVPLVLSGIERSVGTAIQNPRVDLFDMTRMHPGSAITFGSGIRAFDEDFLRARGVLAEHIQICRGPFVDPATRQIIDAGYAVRNHSMGGTTYLSNGQGTRWTEVGDTWIPVSVHSRIRMARAVVKVSRDEKLTSVSRSRNMDGQARVSEDYPQEINIEDSPVLHFHVEEGQMHLFFLKSHDENTVVHVINPLLENPSRDFEMNPGDNLISHGQIIAVTTQGRPDSPYYFKVIDHRGTLMFRPAEIKDLPKRLQEAAAAEEARTMLVAMNIGDDGQPVSTQLLATRAAPEAFGGALMPQAIIQGSVRAADPSPPAVAPRRAPLPRERDEDTQLVPPNRTEGLKELLGAAWNSLVQLTKSAWAKIRERLNRQD